MGKLFSIADIHGRFDLLEALWQKLEAGGLDLTQDKVVFTGDYIDRGPNSAGVVGFVRNLVNKYPGHVIALAGNHEYFMIDALIGRPHARDNWIYNGGLETIHSYQFKAEMESDAKWLASLPLSHEEQPDPAGLKYFFSHAPIPYEDSRGIKAGRPYDIHELTWTYAYSDEEVGADRPGIVGVCGHIHRLSQRIFHPRFYPHYIFGDTGCGCHSKAPLVAINVVTREVIYAWPEGANQVSKLDYLQVTPDGYYVWSRGLVASLGLGQWFKTSDFLCPCGKCDEQKVAIQLMTRLELVRLKLERDIKVTSGYRCAAYQEDLRRRGYETSVGPSQHQLGRAADIVCPGATPKIFARMLELCEEQFKSIGEGLSFLHVDLRDDKPRRRWYYGKRK